MGKLIGKEKLLRATGFGSTHYGNCDQCGKHVSETYVMQLVNKFQREDGSVYYASNTGGAYGHKECLVKYFGEPDVIRESK